MTSHGEEATAVGSAAALQPQDQVRPPPCAPLFLWSEPVCKSTLLTLPS